MRKRKIQVKLSNKGLQFAKSVNEKCGEYDREDIDNLIKEFQNLQAEIYAKIWGLK